MPDRLFRLAASVFVAAIAIVVAVNLIERVLPGLIAVLAIVGAFGGALALVRYRRSRW